MMCDNMRTMIQIEDESERYIHVWRSNYANAKKMMGRWNLTMVYNNGRTETITFDLVEENYPLIIEIDLYGHIDTCYMSVPTKISFRRIHDIVQYNLYRYISDDDESKERMRI